MKETYTAQEVLELMDKISIHFISQKNTDKKDLENLAMVSMAITNVIFTGKYQPSENSLEERLIKISQRQSDGGYPTWFNK